jgi:hypothetical protein
MNSEEKREMIMMICFASFFPPSRLKSLIYFSFLRAAHLRWKPDEEVLIKWVLKIDLLGVKGREKKRGHIKMY